MSEIDGEEEAQLSGWWVIGESKGDELKEINCKGIELLGCCVVMYFMGYILVMRVCRFVEVWGWKVMNYKDYATINDELGR